VAGGASVPSWKNTLPHLANTIEPSDVLYVKLRPVWAPGP